MLICFHSDVKIIIGFEPMVFRKPRNIISKVFETSGSLGD